MKKRKMDVECWVQCELRLGGGDATVLSLEDKKKNS